MFELFLPFLALMWRSWQENISVIPAQIQIATQPAPRVRVLDVETTAWAQGVYDMENDTWSLERRSDEPRPIASITKLMAVLTVLSYNPDLSVRIAFTGDDIVAGGRIYFGSGEQLSREELLEASLVASDNSAITLLARSVEPHRDAFVARMNAVAENLGMVTAHFTDPTGLDPANIASVRDIGKLYGEVLRHNELLAILRKPETTLTVLNTGRQEHLLATDWLTDSFLQEDPYTFMGGKTGYLDEAGYCLVSAVTSGDHTQPIIAIVLGSESKESRMQEVKSLLWTALTYGVEAIR
ncbi:MAG: hypothetical protein COT39_03535 [Parcubacteria group bacterium CG08_land_8_20_14_0_20_48_21]|nr:MAG: hypothetical protein AUK21_04090 [Parcubacteria group bacterium CG2_30_48_51]PIS32654.1 MAG: hypothetical protein COT39_03535 [Parcubacteria group bacterium CG08_land_8_20_14_0_20_48_21]PIW79318.1 MAG: hypothetical protein COZ99_01870 [Parcubacteria group bacterium CG_4_8_14_3_um_filter_48_16]PIY77618.1 MAG: hypothetical protein COY83_04435 [Parcubacteria group bacterium CG_4_10_14_0_8_um_filter_48_154]PIZ77204.1 MAG: hypothetical protein COY03_03780 [bacterium CG_4_10_14_0_2_um_filter_